MSIVSARCPTCNGDITVDNAKDAGICNYCGNPFIVEKAINHYHTHYNVTNNYNADVINTYSGATPQALLKRAQLCLEDGDFEIAEEYCEKVLDMEPTNAQAYLCMLMAILNITDKKGLTTCETIINNHNVFKRALQFADADLKRELEALSNDNLEYNYNNYVDRMRNASLASELLAVSESFLDIDYYKDSRALSEHCSIKGNKLHEATAKINELEQFTSEKREKSAVVAHPIIAGIFAVLVILLFILGTCLFVSILTESHQILTYIICFILIYAPHFIVGTVFTKACSEDLLGDILSLGFWTLGVYYSIYAVGMLFKIGKSVILKRQVSELEVKLAELEKEKANIK
ncbi:MAG: tetratricopeptide repeat protein [Oscillospiraceae bacterium]|nr:tetratricopeptide repeat protein [Oscillospiraceae bacterium]